MIVSVLSVASSILPTVAILVTTLPAPRVQTYGANRVRLAHLIMIVPKRAVLLPVQSQLTARNLGNKVSPVAMLLRTLYAQVIITRDYANDCLVMAQQCCCREHGRGGIGPIEGVRELAREDVEYSVSVFCVFLLGVIGSLLEWASVSEF